MVDDLFIQGPVVASNGVSAVMAGGPLVDEVAPGGIDDEVTGISEICILGRSGSDGLKRCLLGLGRTSIETKQQGRSSDPRDGLDAEHKANKI
jgi:hypothetical protein